MVKVSLLVKDKETSEITNDPKPIESHYCDSDGSVKIPNYLLANELKKHRKVDFMFFFRN